MVLNTRPNSVATRAEDELQRVGTDANKSGNPHCKHLWATILAADSGNYIAAGAKQGYIPPFAAEDDHLDFGAEDWDDVDDDEAYSSIGNNRSQKRADRVSIRAEIEANNAPRLREWESRLSELRKAMQGDDVSNSSASAGRERQIFYEIDAVASEEAGLVIIQTSHRQRRSNGEWGKLKPLKLKPCSGHRRRQRSKNSRDLVGGRPIEVR